MIIDKLREGIAFTNHEQEVARYVLEHIEQIPEMSTNDLAKASFTSKATVVRLCKKIGLSGYQQFKLKLVEEINQKKRMDELLVNEPITDKSTYQDIINALPILYDKAVTNTKLALDQNCMNRIRQVLLRAPVSILFLGPIATFGSTLISEFTLAIRSFSPLLAGGIVGLTWQILVIFGMHWGFIPVYINNVMTLGYDNVMMPFFACTFATSAVVLAIFFKTKNKKLKEMAIPNFISGIFGVTEPAIYGILLPLKKPFIISCIAGGIGGAFYGHFNFRKFILGGMGIFELPNMMNPDGTMGNIIIAFIGIAISMAVGFVLTMIFYRDETKADPLPEETEKTVKKGGKIVIASPLSGKTVPLSEIKDEAFSSGALGEGIAVMPEEGAVYAPVDGTISAFFQTGHAIGMTTENGVQLLIHVGMDTVQLEGKGFKPLAAAGDIVKKGQKLLEFDMDFIKKQGYSLVTPVLVANSSEFDQIICEEKNHVQQGETLLTVE